MESTRQITRRRYIGLGLALAAPTAFAGAWIATGYSNDHSEWGLFAAIAPMVIFVGWLLLRLRLEQRRQQRIDLQSGESAAPDVAPILRELVSEPLTGEEFSRTIAKPESEVPTALRPRFTAKP